MTGEAASAVDGAAQRLADPALPEVLAVVAICCCAMHLPWRVRAESLGFPEEFVNVHTGLSPHCQVYYGYSMGNIPAT
jgi:hypothetical protein